MKDSRPRMATWSLGAVMLLALLVGGGTEPALVTDAIVQCATAIVCIGVLTTKQSTRVDRRLLVFPLCMLAFVVLQATPLPVGLVELFWPPAVESAWRSSGSAAGWAYLTINLPATISCLGTVATASLLLWTLGSLSGEQLLDIVPFVGVGVLANVFAAVSQLSLLGFQPIDNILSYTIRAGMFANQNHFASLILMTIPPIVLFVAGPFRAAALVALFLATMILLAVGSIAGVVVGVAITALAFVLVGRPRQLKPGALIAAGSLLASIAAIGAYNVAFKPADVNAGRLEYLRTALASIWDSPLLGTGFGAFQSSYQIYERAADINSEYVNHAHDDYVELTMGGGLAAVGFVAAYFYLLSTRVRECRRDKVALTAFLSILVVLIHSAVDYPLRTSAILFLFVYAHAVLFADADWTPREPERDLQATKPLAQRGRAHAPPPSREPADAALRSFERRG